MRNNEGKKHQHIATTTSTSKRKKVANTVYNGKKEVCKYFLPSMTDINTPNMYNIV